jgi:hypothetical protein
MQRLLVLMVAVILVFDGSAYSHVAGQGSKLLTR